MSAVHAHIAIDLRLEGEQISDRGAEAFARSPELAEVRRGAWEYGHHMFPIARVASRSRNQSGRGRCE
jgi:hypothetical protein